MKIVDGKFSRGGIDYQIKLGDGVNSNLLICEYFDSGGNPQWRWQSDTDDLKGSNSTYKGDDLKFLQDFIRKLNERLDIAHGDNEDDLEDEDPVVRLTYRINNQLGFDGKHLSINE